MITVPSWLLDVDVRVYVLAAVAVITGVLGRLIHVQRRFERAEEAAARRWSPADASDVGD